MNFFFNKIKYFLLFLISINFLKLSADEFPYENISSSLNQLLIESNNQKSDLKNSVFYAEGDVTITNTNKEFIAKSKKAIFYKTRGLIKLIGDVEVTTSDSSKINAGEILYFVREKKFEAVSNQNQRVNTKFLFDRQITNQPE